MVGIVAPLLGAWALVTVGPRWMFAALGLVQAAAAIPLSVRPNVAVKRQRAGSLPGGTARRGSHRGRRLVRRLLHLRLADRALRLARRKHPGLWRRDGAGRTRRRGLRSAARAPYRCAAMAAAPWSSPVPRPRCSCCCARRAWARRGSRSPPTRSARCSCRCSSRRSATATYNMAKVFAVPFRFQMATEGGWDIGCFAACLSRRRSPRPGRRWRSASCLGCRASPSDGAAVALLCAAGSERDRDGR